MAARKTGKHPDRLEQTLQLLEESQASTRRAVEDLAAAIRKLIRRQYPAQP